MSVDHLNAEAVRQTDATAVCGDRGAVCEQIYEWTGSQELAEASTWLIVTPLTILLIVVVALILNRVARRWSARAVRRLGRETEQHDQLVSDRSAERATQRAETMGTLLKSAVTTVIFVVAALLILELLGISALTTIASAGVFALAIGFGAQSVVADLFAGLFMLAEDQLGVGDRVDVGPVNGYVERMTLRTTVVRAPDGTLWHVPNSEIRYVANEAQSWARATVLITVAYGEDMSRASRVLRDAAAELCASTEWRDDVLEDPTVQAGQDLGDGVDVRVCVHVRPTSRRSIERALRVELVAALRREGIEMPNSAFDVYMRAS